MRKLKVILANFIPVVLMIVLISRVSNDYALSAIYLLIIGIAFRVKYEKKDIQVFFLGLVMLTISEMIFVSTRVETFSHHTLFNHIPIWLPLLWGYSFVAIKRSILVL